jgi:hypothetical protein
MMSDTERDDGGPAFPDPTRGHPMHQGGTGYGDQGMSLRDYFAAHALQLVSTFETVSSFTAIEDPDDAIAKFVYAIADAMLKARIEREDTGWARLESKK